MDGNGCDDGGGSEGGGGCCGCRGLFCVGGGLSIILFSFGVYRVEGIRISLRCMNRLTKIVCTPMNSPALSGITRSTLLPVWASMRRRMAGRAS